MSSRKCQRTYVSYVFEASLYTSPMLTQYNQPISRPSVLFINYLYKVRLFKNIDIIQSSGGLEPFIVFKGIE